LAQRGHVPGDRDTFKHARQATGPGRSRSAGTQVAGTMTGVNEAELPVRLAGRVIPVDPSGRVLLFRYDDPPPKGQHWATPGGGLEPGEDFYAAACRELAEETGWSD